MTPHERRTLQEIWDALDAYQREKALQDAWPAYEATRRHQRFVTRGREGSIPIILFLALGIAVARLWTFLLLAAVAFWGCRLVSTLVRRVHPWRNPGARHTKSLVIDTQK
jgi:hypothetical protein